MNPAIFRETKEVEVEGQNLYAPPQAELKSEFAGDFSESSTYALATRLQRLGAAMLNFLIAGAASVPLVIGFVFLEGSGSSSDEMMIVGALISGVFFMILAAVNIYYLATNGQSLGKKIVGIKIVRGDLKTPASIWRLIFARWLPVYFMGLVPCLGDLAQIGNYLLIFGGEQKCGHDYIADTHVVRADFSYEGLTADGDYSNVAW